MEPASVRVGWLKMLLGVLRRANRRGTYDALCATLERLIAAAERERAGDVRERT
jgi:hypothetical protein